MRIINSKEFASNQNMYFDLALIEQVCIKRGRNLFHIVHTNPNERYIKKSDAVKRFFGAFQSEKSAEEMIDEIRKSRHFNREVEPL